MAKRKKTKAKEEGLLESSEALQEQFSRTEKFFEENKSIVSIVLAVLVIVVGGFVGYRYYINNLNEEAKTEMFQAQYYYEQDSLVKALMGDGSNLGFSDIAYEYGNTAAGNLANYYAGDIYLKQGNYDLAIDFLKEFSADDLIVQGLAYSKIGDAYVEKGEYENAIEYYQKAIDYKPNKEFTPIYLLKLAVTYENINDEESAKSTYNTIIDKFPDAAEYSEARKHYARLGGK